MDTHKDVHAAALTSHGAMLATASFPTTITGYQQLLSWAHGFGDTVVAGVEGTGSWGAGLTRFLRSEGITVIEVNRPNRAMRRRWGKSDTVDAEAAARAVISGQATVVPKTADGSMEAMRYFKLAKDSAVKSRTQAINQLKGVLVNGDPALREQLTGLSTRAQVRHCANLEPAAAGAAITASRRTLRLLAQRIEHLTTEIRELERLITAEVQAAAPKLLDLFGVGHDSAATLLIAAGDNPDRLTGEASFAALCGVSPIEHLSGKTQRRRLNRGGNRQANAALFRIALTRLRADPRTRAYVQRRTTDGRSTRDILRCLERYIAREIFKVMTATGMPATT
ncbi:IS110 family transposase [Dactylosporangium sp. NPDC005572]|uniref:IS110 family transposase n=1 Tax=Dactylosporangium sp. NPDC005572 TaxID=3156889 RepID=UPI0033AAFF8B